MSMGSHSHWVDCKEQILHRRTDVPTQLHTYCTRSTSQRSGAAGWYQNKLLPTRVLSSRPHTFRQKPFCCRQIRSENIGAEHSANDECTQHIAARTHIYWIYWSNADCYGNRLNAHYRLCRNCFWLNTKLSPSSFLLTRLRGSFVGSAPLNLYKTL